MRISLHSPFTAALLGALTLALVFMGSLTPIGSDDTFMNLTLGRHLFNDGTLPTIDPYLFTITEYQWHVWHEWLSYVYYYLLYLIGGLNGIIFVRALVLTGLAAVFWRSFRARATIPPLILSSVILATFIVAFERCRADRASFLGDLLLTFLLLFLLANDRAGKTAKRIWILPLLFLAWVNIHPSYPLGWAFLGLYVLLRWKKWSPVEQKSWLLLTAASVAVTLLNPLGLKGVLYPIQALFISDFGRFKEINTEWVSVFASHLFWTDMKWRIGTFLALGTVIVATGLRHKKWFEFIVTLMLVYLCASAVRFTSIAAFGIGLMILQELESWNWSAIGRRALAFVPVYVVLVAASLFYQPALGAWWPQVFVKGGIYLPNIPISAVRYMAKLPPGNVFNEYTAGGLLAWELGGHMKVAGHGHIDSPELAIQHYWRFSKSPEDFRDIIGNRKVDYFLVLKSVMEATPDSGWVEELQRHWLKIYADDSAVVFKRIYKY